MLLPLPTPPDLSADSPNSGRALVPCAAAGPTAAPLSLTAPYVPLSQRSSDELLTSANELRRMAATATSMDVMNSLRVLADRYTDLAAKRRTDGTVNPADGRAR